MAAGSKGLRVLFVAACPFPCLRGTQARILLQARALTRLGVEVHVATFHLGEFDPPPEIRLHRIASVPWYRSLAAGPDLQRVGLLDPLLLARTIAVARRERVALVHGHHVEGGLVALAAGRLLGLPVVFDAHTSTGAELPSYPLPLPVRWLERVGSELDAHLVRHCDRVLAVSESLRAALLARAAGRVPAQRIEVVPMCLDLEDAPSELAACAARCESDPPTIVYAGGLSRFQGLGLLGRAFERVLAERPEAQLRVVTSDPPRELEAVWPGATRLAPVRFMRPADLADVFGALARAHVAVSPRALPGGFPQKILNYMRAGLPIVAARGSGEMLRDGETAFVVPDDDAEGFAEAILRLLRDPDLRQRLGRAAREEALREYSPLRVAERIVAVYKGMLGDGKLNPDRARAFG